MIVCFTQEEATAANGKNVGFGKISSFSRAQASSAVSFHLHWLLWSDRIFEGHGHSHHFFLVMSAGERTYSAYCW